MILKKYVLVTILILSVSNLSVFGQDDDIFGISKKAKNPKSDSEVGNTFRNVLELISLEISAGGGYQQLTTSFYSPNPILYPLSQTSNFGNSGFSTFDTLSLKSRGNLFPSVNAGIRLQLFNLLTLGGGIGNEWVTLNPLVGNDHTLEMMISSYQMTKMYGTVGIILYNAKRRQSFLNWRYKKYSSSNYYMQSQLRQRARQNYPWRFILEGEFGNLKAYGEQLPNLISKEYHIPANYPVGLYEYFDLKESKYVAKYPGVQNPYYGLSLRIEYDLSDYSKVFLKGGAELREFNYSASDFSEFQTVNQTVYGLQLGLAMKMPGTKRCKIQGCGVVMKHLHNGVEFRGSSIFRFQNRKIGQWY